MPSNFNFVAMTIRLSDGFPYRRFQNPSSARVFFKQVAIVMAIHDLPELSLRISAEFAEIANGKRIQIAVALSDEPDALFSRHEAIPDETRRIVRRRCMPEFRVLEPTVDKICP